MPEDILSTQPPSGLRPDDVIAGRYRLIRKLRDGGMGVIHLARHVALDCEVALKVMNDETAADADGAMRFELEARSAACLGALSDHAVKIMDYGIHLGMPFIVMELLHGEDLADRLRAVGHLSPSAAVRIAHQLTSVLKKAHLLGMVHRDLKPENIFLAQRDEEDSVKLLDYGTLKRLGPSLRAQPTQRIGTPRYMAPEQIQGESVDCRTDLWGFAVVLFEMITGALPFDALDLAGMTHKICFAPAPVPSSVAPHLAGLDPVFRRAFARNPDNRYPSAEELSHAFAEALRISCPPSSAGASPPVIPPLPALPATPVGTSGRHSSRRGGDSTSPTVRCRM